MRAALEVIAERGFHASPMSLIAEKAGVGAGTIYRYFESKDVLINKLHDDLKEYILKILMDKYPSGRTLRERYIHLCFTLLKHFMSHPLHFRFLEQYYNSPYGVSQRRDKILRRSNNNSDIFLKLFDEGVSEGILKDLPVAVFVALSFGPLIVLARDYICGLLELDDELVMKSIEACWDGIRKLNQSEAE
ncbi:MAG: TetR/AcrR family transcriptional regulator [Syntrophales bacterium]|nr:TetR/AcrR family transcriptional regulator [Syntrophales bacterium]